MTTMMPSTTKTFSAPIIVTSGRPVGRRLLPEGSAGAVTHWYPTLWPRVGGRALLRLAGDAFTDPRFSSAYEPGVLVHIYVAGCGEDWRMPTIATGLIGLARRLGIAVHKVSVTAQVNLRDRMRELNADRYGALATSAEGHPCSERLRQLDAAAHPAEGSAAAGLARPAPGPLHRDATRPLRPGV